MAGNGTLTVASLNIRGVPFSRPSPKLRAARISQTIEQLGVDILSLQEVHTYRLLRELRDNLPSLPFVSIKRGILGPAGGLVTLSRRPVESTVFQSLFKVTRKLHSSTLPALTPGGKGILVTELAGTSIVIVNVHLSPNKDGDWSKNNRFWPGHRLQLDTLARLVQSPPVAKAKLAIVNGDFNVAKDSELYPDFIAQSGLQDTFDGDLRPTFHAEFLGGNRQPNCIDYLLVRGGNCQVVDVAHILREKVVLTNGACVLPSDHVGLSATLAHL